MKTAAEERTRRLRLALDAAGLGWAEPLERHEVLASTNETLRERARRGAPAFSVVVADRQTAGRGRQGRAWTSPPGSVYLSVLLRPHAAVAGLVPLLGGVAAAEALASFGVEARVKWPNDVLVGERKLAGVLAEAASGALGLEWVVLGVGANVDPEGELPEGATSLAREMGRTLEVEAVCAAILGRIRVWYHALASGRAEDLRARWKELSVAWWGREVVAGQGEMAVAGLARDIDEDGALVLERPGGRFVRVRAGDVAQVRLEPPAGPAGPRE